MTLTETQAETLYFDGAIEGFKKIQESHLEADHKCDVGSYVFQDLATQKFYEGSVCRVGEAWSSFDWYFDTDFYEVEQVEVVVKQWKRK